MPVILAKKALDAGEATVRIRVDNAVAVENLKRLASSTGRQAQTEEISVDIVLGRGVSATSGMRITFQGGPTDVTPANLSGLEEINLLDDDPQTLDMITQLLTDSAQSFGVKLFKLIPAPLMTPLFMN